VEQHRGADDAKHEAMIVYKLYQDGVFKIDLPKSGDPVECYQTFNYYSGDSPVEWGYGEDYEIVVDMITKKVVCILGEPEDRSFSRDLSGLLELLNKNLPT